MKAAKTPFIREPVLKGKIRKDLAARGAYFYMPVPAGYGKQTVDFLCCVPSRDQYGKRIGLFVAIETKTTGNKPTRRQEGALQAIVSAGGVAFWCDSWEGYLRGMQQGGFVVVFGDRAAIG